MKGRKIFLDVGGHFGQTLNEVLSGKYDFDKVYCFEPMPAIAKFLYERRYTSNMSYEDMKNSKYQLEVLNYGLLDKTEQRNVYGSEMFIGASIYKQKEDINSGDETPCAFVEASEFFREHINLNDTVIMKLNCEGSEVKILTNLVESGEIKKIANVMVDFDVKKIPGLEHQAGETVQLMRDNNFHNFVLCDDVMIGATHEDRIGHWLSTLSFFDQIKAKPMKEHESVFTSIWENYGFGGTESRSGPGSEFEHTADVRKWLKKIIPKYGIKSLVDIPCGDFNWMHDVVPSLESYVGGDIVAQCAVQNTRKYGNDKTKFIHFDLLADAIPAGDALLLRDILGHYSVDNGYKIVQNVLNSNCKYVISTTWYNINDPEYYKAHDNRGADTGRFYPINLMSAPFNFPEPNDFVEEVVHVDGHDLGVRKTLAIWEIGRIKNPSQYPPIIRKIPEKQTTTIVTGLWNIGRVGRDFDHYIDHFRRLMDVDANMFIYIPKELEYLVWEKRSRKNTYVKIFELEDIKTLMSPFWDNIQKIRTSPEWLNITGEGGWLKQSPQALNEWYNPVVMAKMPMLHSASCWNPFGNDKFIWIDAGLTHTVYEKYLVEENALKKMEKHLDPFLFLSYPYENPNEIHGFVTERMNHFAQAKVKYVCRGGLFGGTKAAIDEANGMYYSTLMNTINSGFMGTEECIFTIMSYLKPEIFRRFELDENGLIVKYIAELVNNTAQLVPISPHLEKFARVFQNAGKSKTDLYILTFNFPEQLTEILKSLEKAGWLAKANNVIVIDNSNKDESVAANAAICEKHGATHVITGKNEGICGGRMLAAQMFDASDADFYMFFEDDMLFYTEEDNTPFCRNGFRTIVPNLFDKLVKIMQKEEFDFLKLSFTEVYMDNHIQVSWYNIPQAVRTSLWPNYDKLPIHGLDPNCPRTNFNTIDNVDGLSYITGDVYYANWPMIMGKVGNRKVFLETTWAHPFEQTWMSHVFQEMIKGNIYGAILLASPIRHNRTSHYKPEERREN